MGAWTRVYGPDDHYQVCDDDALFEIGSVYGYGPTDQDGHSRWECEIVYYVIRQESDGRYGTECMTHTYRNADGDIVDDEYDYDIAGYLSHETLEQAISEATRMANADESWKLDHWRPDVAVS